MNLPALLAQTWRITWRNWRLWVLNLALFVVALPTFTLGGALGGLGAMLAVPSQAGPTDWLTPLRAIPGWAWLIISFITLVLVVLTSAVTWLLQAAAMRGAAIAAERGTFTLREALHLGGPRVVSIVQLSLTLGFLLGLLSLAPFPLLFIARNSPLGLPLMEMAQVGLAPFNTTLSVALLLIMMSVALEDLRPRAALHQAWRVFGQGWWAFLLVIAFSSLPGFAIALLTIPAVIVAVVTLRLAPALLPGVALGLCACLGPLILGLILFTAVFTVVLYTLVYRAATQQLARSR